MAIEVSSPTFDAGSAIPKKYTGEGRDISPPLIWRGVPEGTKEIALICDDPDAPRAEPWVHWVVEAAAGLIKDQLLEAMEGHILDEGELVGTYERK